ncbi:MAG: choline-sulfatase [Alphaproteobacteria bacterium]
MNSTKSPNIVLIMADQLAPHFIGAYGHSVVKTPNIDALAASGMRFDAAYCNSPLCAPSRFSFMSGQLISRIAAYDNASEFSSQIPTFAHYLQLQGYTTCLSGKMHFVGPDQMHGFQDRVTTDIYPSDYAWTPEWEANDERIDRWYHNMQTVKESGMAMATFQIDYDDEVGFAAQRRLFDYARDEQKPFCMVASFIHPHDPYVARPEWWNLYKDSEIVLPKVEISWGDQDPYSQRLLNGIEAAYTPLTTEEVIRARRAYYANVSYFDSKVGQLVQTIEEIGETDNTIFVITADHGDMLGERGLWYKMNFFEYSARVPLIMCGPGVAQGSSSSACSLVDILPTLVDIGSANGSEKPEFGQRIDGRSLWPVAEGGTDSKSEAIGEYCAECAGSPVVMIRRDDFKYIHCDGDPAQLYNVAADPDELVNLQGDHAHLEISRSFAAEVAAKWDLGELKKDVISTQRSRRALHAAMEAAKERGGGEHWDYQPPYDASQQYVRNHAAWTEQATRFRYPKL